MQPAPKRDERLVVDPRPGNGRKIFIPKPNPRAKKPGTGQKVPNPGMGTGRGRVAPLPIDDRIYRTMPITEKQLGAIKKYYGIK